MNLDDFLRMLEDLLELDAGSLQGNEQLADLEAWDSMSVVSFMGMVKAKFGLNLSAKTVSGARSISDLHQMVLNTPKPD